MCEHEKNPEEIPDLVQPEVGDDVKGGATSGYIGETEKNLGRVFKSAEGTNASLLFTESDDLFKK